MTFLRPASLFLGLAGLAVAGSASAQAGADDQWRVTVSPYVWATSLDGNVTLADVPERKQDLVNGRYELPAPPAGSTVAVKIIDMLGEELVVTTAI